MKPSYTDIPDGMKSVLDITSIATLFGTLTAILPAVASVVTIVWTCIRIFETATVQALLGRKKDLP